MTGKAVGQFCCSLVLAAGLCGIATQIYASDDKTVAAQTVKVVAKRFSYTPAEIVLKKGTAYVLELTSTDDDHGFKCPGLGLRTAVHAGATAKVAVTPTKTGTFDFFCDVYCGDGHDDMAGKIIVK